MEKWCDGWGSNWLNWKLLLGSPTFPTSPNRLLSGDKDFWCSFLSFFLLFFFWREFELESVNWFNVRKFVILKDSQHNKNHDIKYTKLESTKKRVWISIFQKIYRRLRYREWLEWFLVNCCIYFSILNSFIFVFRPNFLGYALCISW